MTKEEWVGESEAEMRAWEGKARRKLLSKGVGFRRTPDEISRDEKRAGVRAVVSMIRIVRGRLREETYEYRGKGRRADETTWDEALGLRHGCFQRETIIGARTAEAWGEVLNTELEQGVATKWKEKVAGTAERGGWSRRWQSNQASSDTRTRYRPDRWVRARQASSSLGNGLWVGPWCRY